MITELFHAVTAALFLSLVLLAPAILFDFRDVKFCDRKTQEDKKGTTQ